MQAARGPPLSAGTRGPLVGARIDQILPNVSPGDAASDSCLTFGRMLAAAGAESRLWAKVLHPDRRDRAALLNWKELRRRAPDLVLLHHTTGSAVPGELRRSGLPYGLYFHNVTPPRYFLGANDLLAGIGWRGLSQVGPLLDRARVVMAPSSFSADQLRAAGAPHVDLVPIPFDPDQRATAPDPDTLERFREGTNVLFVGRLAPNKRQDELLPMFRYYSTAVNNSARLLLVGSPAAAPAYAVWLRRAVEMWGLGRVHLLGHVSAAVREACYRVARVFVSMSEHEGFGVPLIEAMHHGVPVIARDSAAVAGTIGGGGLVVRNAEPQRLAALVGLVAGEGALRAQLIEAGRRRVADLTPDRVATPFVAALGRALAR